MRVRSRSRAVLAFGTLALCPSATWAQPSLEGTYAATALATVEDGCGGSVWFAARSVTLELGEMRTDNGHTYALSTRGEEIVGASSTDTYRQSWHLRRTSLGLEGILVVDVVTQRCRVSFRTRLTPLPRPTPGRIDRLRQRCAEGVGASCEELAALVPDEAPRLRADACRLGAVTSCTREPPPRRLLEWLREQRALGLPLARYQEAHEDEGPSVRLAFREYGQAGRALVARGTQREDERAFDAAARALRRALGAPDREEICTANDGTCAARRRLVWFFRGAILELADPFVVWLELETRVYDAIPAPAPTVPAASAPTWYCAPAGGADLVCAASESSCRHAAGRDADPCLRAGAGPHPAHALGPPEAARNWSERGGVYRLPGGGGLYAGLAEQDAYERYGEGP